MFRKIPMPKESVKTLIISSLLFLVFCLVFFPSMASAGCWCMCYGNLELGDIGDSNSCNAQCLANKVQMQSCNSYGNQNSQSGAASFVPQIGIPGSEFQPGASVAVSNNTATIANYVKAIYKYLIGIVGITAAIMLMAGGIVWLTAGGSPERVKQAQDYIVGSLTGLGLALGSFLILATINPALVNFRISGLQTVAGDANSSNTAYCCVPNNSTDKNCRPITQAMECETGYSKQPSSCPGIAQCSNSTSANTSCCISPSSINPKCCRTLAEIERDKCGTIWSGGLFSGDCAKYSTCQGKPTCSDDVVGP
jgi:hypothetical protein